ncbi:MAG: hypothetical protein J7K26_02695, partial [Candidatus Aenigmarchaeota archaeon]|nr:hypothetical protein [Candidatus Aenigmarchaeota archaeon]
NLTINNLLDKDQNIKIKFRNQTKIIHLANSNTITFQYIPFNIDDNIIRIYIEAEDFSTSITRILSLSKKKSLLDSFFAFLRKIFSGFR